MQDLAVKIDDLEYAFHDKKVLKDISLRLESNKIYGLLGRNGAGKTTLINLMVNQLIAKNGRITLFGKDPRVEPDILEQVCVIRETAFFAPYMKVKAIFELYRQFYPLYDQILEEKMTDFFKLPVDKPYHNYSKGMKTLVFNIIGLCSHAPLTIFDEPASGLDAEARDYFYNILLEEYAKSPRTILISTHLIDEVENLLEEVLILEEGKIILSDSVDSFKEKAFYLTGLEEVMDTLQITAGKKPKTCMGKTRVYSCFGILDAGDKEKIRQGNVEVIPMRLQEAFVELSREKRAENEIIEEEL